MSGSVAVIRNPRSGRGSGARMWPDIERRLREALGERLVSVETTSGPGSAAEQARRLVEQGVSTIVGAGGDGTVSQVMHGLVGTQSALALLPLGTGNDFARTLGIGANPEKAIAVLAEGSAKSIDIARWSRGEEEGYFINVAGCGFDAVVADRINQGVRHLRGTAAYLVAIMQTLGSFRAVDMEIEVDGERIEQKAMLCAFANAKSYGGGMLVAPDADIHDGLLDLVIVGELSTLSFLRAFPRVFKGTHLSHPAVLHRRFRKLRLSSSSSVPFLVDGEVLPPGDVEVEVLPGRLRVVSP